MFRSSIVAFYPCLVCLFYNSAGSVRRVTFLMFRLLLRIRSKVEKINHWMPEILFAAEIAFRGLDRCVPAARTESAQAQRRGRDTASHRVRCRSCGVYIFTC